MRLLEKVISGYQGHAASTETAVLHLLIDLRHYCDQHGIDFENPMEESLDVYLDEVDAAES